VVVDSGPHIPLARARNGSKCHDVLVVADLHSSQFSNSRPPCAVPLPPPPSSDCLPRWARPGRDFVRKAFFQGFCLGTGGGGGEAQSALRGTMDLSAAKRRPIPPDHGGFSTDALGERRGGGGEGSDASAGVHASHIASPPHHRPLCPPESSPAFAGRVPTTSPPHWGMKNFTSPTAALMSGSADGVSPLRAQSVAAAVSPTSVPADGNGVTRPQSHTRPLLQGPRDGSSPPFPGYVSWLSTAPSPSRHALPKPGLGEGRGAPNGVGTATVNGAGSFTTPVKRSDSTASPAASLRYRARCPSCR
jgi:hypothetical protein